MKLSQCNNIEDLRRMAERRLPAPMFHYIDGAADDEWTKRRNTEAFSDYELMPNYLVDIDNITTKTQILGAEIDLPFFLAPTGMSRLFHIEKELAVAQAAAKFGTYYSLSTMATTSIEDVAAVNAGPKMFQVYMLKDQELTKEFVQRCKNADYTSMCLTVDTIVAGNRERDAVHGMSLPPKFTLGGLLSFVRAWRWTLSLAKDNNFALSNIVHRLDAIGGDKMGLIQYLNSQFDRSISWDKAAWLVEEWGGPFALKGIQSVGDAKKAVEIGASAIMISNHGGRQLDSAPAPVDCIQAIRDEVGDKLEIIVDGGVRRGTHVLKSLALGADAVSFGRPYLYGLAAGGQVGVEHALQLLKDEVIRDMQLMGVTSIDQIGPQHIARLGQRPL
jgi:L-lactate dehydrogenase (cytochrome)